MLHKFLLFLGCLLSIGAQAQTSLSIDRSGGSARITLSGDPGDYTLEGSSSLAPDSWELLLTTPLAGSSVSWIDADSTFMPHRFYRAIKLDSAPAPLVAPDFRLIDHQGVSRSLHYYMNATNTRVIVLIFTGNGCTNVHQMIPALNTLRTRFSPSGVLFWMVDANAADNRTNIVTEATARGITMPILHDAAQLVARAYNATATPEAFALKHDQEIHGWSIAYRGAIDDRLSGNPVPTTQFYLSNALVRILAGQPVAPLQTRAQGCSITLNPPQQISYAADIAPLLQAKCVRCHSPGNIAPWAMTNYDIVHLARGSIKQEVLSGHMPPWHADPAFGSFANDASLQPAEAAKLVQWIDDGAPRGTGPDPLLDVPPDPPAWALGTPTNIVTIPVQTIPAYGQSGNGEEPYHYVNVTTTFPTDVWIRGAVVRPGNVRIVHHCLVYFGTNSQLSGMDGFFAGYVPGYDPVFFPAGTAKFLPRGTVLRFQMHYVTTSQDETDQTQLGLYTTPAAPTYTLQTRSAYNFLFSIPAGNPDYQTTASYGPFPRAVYLYEMSPHMHLRGSRFKYEAVYPNNSRETLLSVPFYRFHWQTLYRLAQPKMLPAGTRIAVTGAWDNSQQNLHNPDPTRNIGFGEQTDDEMFIGYFNFAEIP